jgi:hypothetical protein
MGSAIAMLVDVDGDPRQSVGKLADKYRNVQQFAASDCHSQSTVRDSERNRRPDGFGVSIAWTCIRRDIVTIANSSAEHVDSSVAHGHELDELARDWSFDWSHVPADQFEFFVKRFVFDRFGGTHDVQDR